MAIENDGKDQTLAAEEIVQPLPVRGGPKGGVGGGEQLLGPVSEGFYGVPSAGGK